MMKHKKISDFLESCPQFFKVYLPDRSSHQLQVPPDFVKYFTGVFPCKSSITIQEKGSWHVELKKVDGHFYFQEGWQEFVLVNFLEFGDFLVFYYCGNAQFYVKIYGKNGCPKEVSKPTGEIDRCITEPQDNQMVLRRKSKRLAQGANGGEIAQTKWCPRFSLAIQGISNKAYDEASKFVSEFPFFKVVMSRSSINGSEANVHIPRSFHNRYVEKDRQGVILVASDRSWPVKLSRNDKNTRFVRGWDAFCRDNMLEVDDVCVFELIEKNDFVLKVSIFRWRD